MSRALSNPEKLRAAMAALGLDQKDVSRRSGESVSHISNYLRGSRTLTTERLDRILASLHVEAPTVESYLADFEGQVTALMKQLRINLLTATATPDESPAIQRAAEAGLRQVERPAVVPTRRRKA